MAQSPPAPPKLVATGGEKKYTFEDVCPGDLFEAENGSVWQKVSRSHAHQIQSEGGVMSPVPYVSWDNKTPIAKIAHERFRITLIS